MVIDITQTPYNLTKLINSSSLGNLMTNIAPVIGGYYLGMAFLLIIFLVSFLYMKGMGKFLNRSCVMGALSLTLISAILLFSMGMIAAAMLWFIIFAWIATMFFIALVLED
jgi:asparagine N-glycosylation enzyme membrane subunit Stt3